jgi:hypothetical protein
MVVTRTFSNGLMDGRTDDRTMAAGAFVTWTHCSVLFEVTWDKTRCVHADATMRPHERTRVRADTRVSARLLGNIRADASPSPPLSLPSPLTLPPLRCPHGREKNKQK